MKLGSLSSARPSIYDRNATGTMLFYNANGVAPHAETTRWTQTVAAGKKAIVEGMYTAKWRDGAAGAASLVWSMVKITSGGNTAVVSGIIDAQATTYITSYMGLAGAMTIYAGETVFGVTADISTGGTNAYWNTAKITTFDG